jgi:PKD repeat protein
VSIPSQVNAVPAGVVPFVCVGTSSASGGSIQVYFDPIDLTMAPPQACSFNVHAKTSPGLTITALKWDFGDGSKKYVPYCCQTQVSEIQYHAYDYSVNPKPYTVTVVAYDNAKQSGYVQAVVNWSTPVPEYSNYGVTLLLSLLLVPILIRRRRRALPA